MRERYCDNSLSDRFTIMSLLPHDEKRVAEFFSAIASWRQAYTNCSLSYLALKKGEEFAIVQARLWLSVADQAGPFSHFRSPNVRAGRYAQSELALDAHALVRALVEGKLATPNGDLSFRGADGTRHSASFTPFNAEALQQQRRVSVLQIMGGMHPSLPQTQLDWELKASNPPYDGLQELASEFFLGSLSNGPAHVDVVALNVAEVDIGKTTVIDTKALFTVLLATGLPRERLQLGYRVLSQGRTVARSVVNSRSIEWTQENGRQFGKVSIDVPKSAVVNGVVSFDGVAQHHWWFSDPSTFQNTRRAVYEAFDAKLERLREALERPNARGQDARQLESAVAWIMWMLGFSVAHLGGIPRLQDAADIVAATPTGNFAVVECTTGLLRAENKLALLHNRTEAVRRSLVHSNETFRRVISILVTSKTRTEVKPELEHAERIGMLIVTRDEFNSLVDRTLALPDADKLYAEAEEAIRSRREAHEAEPRLPLE